MCALYTYQGIAQSGKETKGTIDADSLRSAREKLKAQGVFPTKLSETKEKSKGASIQIEFKSKKVTTMQLALATRQLATLINSGMPLVDSLKALSEQVESSTLQEAITNIRDKVNEGSNFNQSLEDYPHIFPKLYVRMVKSGETSGTLDTVLGRLADILESQAILKRKIVSALTYPVLMLFLCLGVVLILLGFVVPQISQIFKDQKKALPLPTQVIVSASGIVQNYWWLIIICIVAAMFGIKKYIQSPKGRAKYDKFLVTNILFGGLSLKLATSRFATNLGTMLKSGVELLTALTILKKDILGNVYLEEIIENALEGVEHGKSLSLMLSQNERFPKMLVHMTAIGEQTGELDNMLLRVGKNFESEVDASIAGLTSLLEPILIVFLAVVVGGILLAVMLPMLEITSIGK